MPRNLGPRTARAGVKLNLGPRGAVYEPQRVLGRGAFGVAYLVIHPQIGPLAMKRVDLSSLNEKQKEETKHECEVLAREQPP